MAQQTYLFIGTPNCGRRAIIADLLDYGLGDDAEITLYLPRAERDSEAENLLAKNPRIELRDWIYVPAPALGVPAEIELPDKSAEAENVAFMLDGNEEPIDQIEAFAALAKHRGWEIARVIVIVDCQFAKSVPASADFYKALIHFADVVLLANRGDISMRWFEDFKKPFKDECFPCVFEFVKKNRVANAAATLSPVARRMTFIFDEIDPIDDLEIDEENLPTEPFDIVAKPDPYFERNDNGARKIAVPSIKVLRGKI